MGKSTRSIKKKKPIKNDADIENYSTYSKSELLKKKHESNPSAKSNFKLLKWSAVASILIILLLFSGAFSPGTKPGENDFVKSENLPINTFTAESGDKISVILYTSPSCECCVVYADYLTDNGFEVFVKRVDNLNEIKNNYLIPTDQWSCHTIIMGDYFTEGHIPLSVVYDLLSNTPAIDGIALPDMPLGTPGMGADNPGMGGDKEETWVISSILNGQVIGIFATI